LDADNRRRVLEYLAKINQQVFISVIAAESIGGEVEIQGHFDLSNGQVRKMV